MQDFPIRLSNNPLPSDSFVSMGENSSYGVHDTFRNGLASVRSQIIQGHPLEQNLKNSKESSEQLRYALHQRTQGYHSVLRMEMDKAYLNQIKRLPVFGNHNLALDILNGRDNDIEFEDFLGSSLYSTKTMDVHGSMEHKLGMN